jgi:hypothetical protein
MIGQPRRFRRIRRFLRAIVPALLGILVAWLAAKLLWAMLVLIAGLVW